MKKINIKKYLEDFESDISLAKANHFEAIIIPFNDCEVYPFNNINDKDFIYDIAYDYGWDIFLIIDLITDTQHIIDLSLDAA